MLKLFLSQLFYYFYKLEVLNGQELRSLHLWMLKTKVGLEGRLRRKAQLLPQPAELLFPDPLGEAVIDSSFRHRVSHTGNTSPQPPLI